MIHICDWYATFASYFGLDAADQYGPTPVNAIDMLPYLTGTSAAGTSAGTGAGNGAGTGAGTGAGSGAPSLALPSPRTEIVHDHLMHCVPDGVQPTAQCVRGQTDPGLPRGALPQPHNGGLDSDAAR